MRNSNSTSNTIIIVEIGIIRTIVITIITIMMITVI